MRRHAEDGRLSEDQGRRHRLGSEGSSTDVLLSEGIAANFSAWVDLRRTEARSQVDRFDFAALPGWRAAQWVDDLVGAADLVIIDAAPHAEA